MGGARACARDSSDIPNCEPPRLGLDSPLCMQQPSPSCYCAFDIYVCRSDRAVRSQCSTLSWPFVSEWPLLQHVAVVVDETMFWPWVRRLVVSRSACPCQPSVVLNRRDQRSTRSCTLSTRTTHSRFLFKRRDRWCGLSSPLLELQEIPKPSPLFSS